MNFRSPIGSKMLLNTKLLRKFILTFVQDLFHLTKGYDYVVRCFWSLPAVASSSPWGSNLSSKWFSRMHGCKPRGREPSEDLKRGQNPQAFQWALEGLVLLRPKINYAAQIYYTFIRKGATFRRLAPVPMSAFSCHNWNVTKDGHPGQLLKHPGRIHIWLALHLPDKNWSGYSFCLPVCMLRHPS